jgi:hypothetical protein
MPSPKAAEQVDGGEGLDFLKTLGQGDKHGGHGEKKYQAGSNKYQEAESTEAGISS